MKEFIGRISLDKRMQRRQYECRMNQNHQHRHRQENTQRITQTVIKLLPSITNRIPVFARHDQNSSSLSSSSCSSPPLVSLESPDDKSIPERLGRPPSQHVNLTNSPPRSCGRPATCWSYYE